MVLPAWLSQTGHVSVLVVACFCLSGFASAPHALGQAPPPTTAPPPAAAVPDPLAAGVEATSAWNTGTAAWAPVRGNFEVLCTQSNPGWGGCSGRHRNPAIDIRMPAGTGVYAAGDGVVHESRDNGGGRGRFIAIRHPDGRYSRYLHLSQRLVGHGARVVAGQLIGRSGNTGSSSTPHLHYDEQKPYDRHVPMGTMYAVHGNQRVAYPNHLGVSAWSSVRYGSRLINDRAPYQCDGYYATHMGTRGNDWIVGNSRNNVVVTLAGADVISTGRGRDRICSGSGNDLVAAGPHGDWVIAGSGRDIVAGNGSGDFIMANQDPDLVDGGGGNDWIWGGSGSDPRLDGGRGNDIILGGTGNDFLLGNSGTDVCHGEGGTDTAELCEEVVGVP